MAAKMLINIHEALEYLDVSSEDDLYDGEDSLAGVSVDLRTSSSNILLDAGDEEEVAGPSVDMTSKRVKGKCIFVSLTSF